MKVVETQRDPAERYLGTVSHEPSRRRYRQALEIFRESEPGLFPSLEPAALRRYREALEPYADSTRNVHIAALRGLLGYQRRMGEMDHRKPSEVARLEDVLGSVINRDKRSRDEVDDRAVEAVVTELVARGRPIDLRDAALIVLCRHVPRSVAVRIRWNQLGIPERGRAWRFNWRDKRSSGEAELSPQEGGCLLRWRDIHPPQEGHGVICRVRKGGAIQHNQNITTSAAHARIREVFKAIAGLDVSPDMLRLSELGKWSREWGDA